MLALCKEQEDHHLAVQHPWVERIPPEGSSFQGPAPPTAGSREGSAEDCWETIHQTHSGLLPGACKKLPGDLRGSCIAPGSGSHMEESVHVALALTRSTAHMKNAAFMT